MRQWFYQILFLRNFWLSSAFCSTYSSHTLEPVSFFINTLSFSRCLGRFHPLGWWWDCVYCYAPGGLKPLLSFTHAFYKILIFDLISIITKSYGISILRMFFCNKSVQPLKKKKKKKKKKKYYASSAQRYAHRALRIRPLKWRAGLAKDIKTNRGCCGVYDPLLHKQHRCGLRLS